MSVYVVFVFGLLWGLFMKKVLDVQSLMKKTGLSADKLGALLDDVTEWGVKVNNKHGQIEIDRHVFGCLFFMSDFKQCFDVTDPDMAFASVIGY